MSFSTALAQCTFIIQHVGIHSLKDLTSCEESFLVHCEQQAKGQTQITHSLDNKTLQLIPINVSQAEAPSHNSFFKFSFRQAFYFRSWRHGQSSNVCRFIFKPMGELQPARTLVILIFTSLEYRINTILPMKSCFVSDLVISSNIKNTLELLSWTFSINCKRRPHSLWFEPRLQ